MPHSPYNHRAGWWGWNESLEWKKPGNSPYLKLKEHTWIWLLESLSEPPHPKAPEQLIQRAQNNEYPPLRIKYGNYFTCSVRDEWNVHKTMAHTHTIDNMMTVFGGNNGAARTRNKFDWGSQVSSLGVRKYGEKLLLHPVSSSKRNIRSESVYIFSLFFVRSHLRFQKKTREIRMWMSRSLMWNLRLVPFIFVGIEWGFR